MMIKITSHNQKRCLSVAYKSKQAISKRAHTHSLLSRQVMVTIKSALCLSFCILGINIAQATSANVISITNPDVAYGINIGDKLSRKVVIETQIPYKIESTAFPKKGTKTNGIELVDVAVESDQQKTANRYTVLLSYQVFANKSTPTVMQLPNEKISLSGGDSAEAVDISAWNFWFSPLVVGGITVAENNLLPQFKPPLVDVSPTQTRLTVFLGLLLTGLLGLLYINADGQWLPFMGGAFAKAHRQLKRLSKNTAPKTQLDEKKALVYIHQAFNKVYGANIFARDIDHFVAQHPSFKKAKTEIEQFFNDSNRSLYVIDANNSAQVILKLVQLSKQLRDCERGV